MPTPLSLAEQERLDAIKRKQQLERLYQKYGADKTETPVEPAKPDTPWYKRAANAVTGGLEQMGSSSQQAEASTTNEPVKKKKKKISNEDALKLNTQGGQIEYLNQES